MKASTTRLSVWPKIVGPEIPLAAAAVSASPLQSQSEARSIQRAVGGQVNAGGHRGAGAAWRARCSGGGAGGRLCGRRRGGRGGVRGGNRRSRTWCSGIRADQAMSFEAVVLPDNGRVVPMMTSLLGAIAERHGGADPPLRHNIELAFGVLIMRNSVHAGVRIVRHRARRAPGSKASVVSKELVALAFKPPPLARHFWKTHVAATSRSTTTFTPPRFGPFLALTLPPTKFCILLRSPEFVHALQHVVKIRLHVIDRGGPFASMLSEGESWDASWPTAIHAYLHLTPSHGEGIEYPWAMQYDEERKAEEEIHVSALAALWRALICHPKHLAELQLFPESPPPLEPQDLPLRGGWKPSELRRIPAPERTMPHGKGILRSKSYWADLHRRRSSQQTSALRPSDYGIPAFHDPAAVFTFTPAATLPTVRMVQHNGILLPGPDPSPTPPPPPSTHRLPAADAGRIPKLPQSRLARELSRRMPPRQSPDEILLTRLRERAQHDAEGTSQPACKRRKTCPETARTAK
ncbi:hypothetical protein DFH07DRAFT_784212 [Mycena maculata]|uniref:Uncharacterized protein n=1 Tax=Mycena maculata TaxID=230809 RepID=A0AAD7HI04_9AGAR|nr:hypothetical protein DFH07DRAFT_784212 [Mycena maculata]